MDNFVVSARKYRPQDFNSVVGQSHITTTLRNAIRHNQLAHAFLFCGPRGVGKTTCARILAKTINCENISPDAEACNRCQSCKSFNEGTSLNIHELDGASNNLVDDMRSLIEQVRYPPQGGKYKVYIIDEVHMLSHSAFNAFLKTLEEPPPFVIFILATTEKHKIIPTILSRCQVFDFRRITIQDTVTHLAEICKKEGIVAEPDALHLIAQKSEGCLRDSLSILDKIVAFTSGQVTYRNTLDQLDILDYDYFFQVLEAILAQDASRSLLILDEVLQKGFEGDNFLDGVADFIRNLLVCKDDRVLHLLEVSPGLEGRYRKAAGQADAALLVSALQIMSEVAASYRQARNKRLHIEIALVRLCYLSQAIRLISDERTGEVSKKKLTDPGGIHRLRQPFARPLGKGSPGKSLPSPPKAPPVAAEVKPPEPEPAPPLAEVHSGPTLKLTGLKGMKTQLNLKPSVVEPVAIIPATAELLEMHWKAFVEQFKTTNKSSAAAFLESARVGVDGPGRITITSSHIIQQRFIEEEKIAIAEFLKKAFLNPGLVISMEVREDMTGPPPPPAPLSAREQYLRMAEKYPLLRELKEKLNLDLNS